MDLDCGVVYALLNSLKLFVRVERFVVPDGGRFGGVYVTIYYIIEYDEYLQSIQTSCK